MTVNTPIGNPKTITAENQFTNEIFVKNRGFVSITHDKSVANVSTTFITIAQTGTGESGSVEVACGY